MVDPLSFTGPIKKNSEYKHITKYFEKKNSCREKKKETKINVFQDFVRFDLGSQLLVRLSLEVLRSPSYQ